MKTAHLAPDSDACILSSSSPTSRTPPALSPIAVPQHGPSMLRTFAMSTNFVSIPSRLASHPEEARTLGNLNETCLHWSCFHRGPAYAILPIAKSFPEACGIVGACGRNPLHIVCAGGGRGSVNALEETVDLVEKLVGYNVNMSCLVSVEDGETPISGLWGVYTRQCGDFLKEVLRKLGDGVEEADNEYRSLLKRILNERKAERIQKFKEEKTGKASSVMVPPMQHRNHLSLPAWAREIPTITELEAGTSCQKRGRSVSPPRADDNDRHARRRSPPHIQVEVPSIPIVEPCECPSQDPVEMPPTFKSQAEEMDEDIRTLLVQIEKMLMLCHAADYALAMYPKAFPEPLATESPIGGHFIFHPPPEKVPERVGTVYGPYWNDDSWNPIQGAIRVYERMGELGCPESFMRLLIALFPDLCNPTKKNERGIKSTSSCTLPPLPLHVAAASSSIPTSIIEELLKTSSSAAQVSCSLASGHVPRMAFHVAISSGRAWDDCVKSILDANPAVLSVRDAETGLYPFMLAATKESADPSSRPAMMQLGEGKHMVPVPLPPVDTNAQEQGQLRSLDTVFKLLLECPSLVNRQTQH